VFLEEMFELRVQAARDAPLVKERAAALRAGLMGELDEVFRRWSTAEGGLHGVEDLLAKLKYVDNLLVAAAGPDVA
jgi:NTP pyrophosphatase (non-canonical NTP hydrolase)